MVAAVRDIIGQLTGRKGLGVLGKDVVRKTDYDVARLALPTARVSHVSMVQHVQRVRDQQWFGRCVGSAFAGGIEDREAFLGRRGVHVSDDFIYALARAYGGTLDYDSGADVSLAARAVSRLGAALDSARPLAQTTKQLCRAPTPLEYESAHDRQGGTYYAVRDDSPSGRVQAVRGLLQGGFPPVVISPVYRSWQPMEWPTAEHMIDVPARGDEEIGWHAYRVVAIDSDDSVMILNSWGRGWRDAGFARMSRDFLTLRIATVRVMDGWRGMLRA